MIWFLVAALIAAVMIYAVVSAAPGAKRSRGRQPGTGGVRRLAGRVNVEDIRSRWGIIMATSKTGPAGLKIAITEADKLLDYVMKTQGYSGGTMGERLKAAKSGFGDYGVYNAVWQAHKLRNTMVHDVGFDLVVSQANEALTDFERGLRKLGAL